MGATATDSIKESNIHKNYHIIINEAAGVLKPKLSQINVFTDGSETKHGVGAGFIVWRITDYRITLSLSRGLSDYLIYTYMFVRSYDYTHLLRMLFVCPGRRNAGPCMLFWKRLKYIKTGKSSQSCRY